MLLVMTVEKPGAKQALAILQKIRNPQVAILDDQFILHGREAGDINAFVLYTSEDGILWDEGHRIVDYHPAISF